MVRPKGNRRTIFACRDCGHESTKWSGFCTSPVCGSSLPLVEMKPSQISPSPAGWTAMLSQPVQELSQLDPDGRPIMTLPGQEINRVLGGGIVAGSVVLLTGEPGVGKSTLVRETGLRLMQWAKSNHTPVFLAGHVTKDGSVAGPRVLEHMVDVVAYLEAQDDGPYRILRNSKNRFGSTAEVGVFEMTARGLTEVTDPSQAMLAQRCHEAVGSAVVPVLEGNRPMMLEVQALTSPSHGPVPRRVGNGVDYNRLLMLVAVASRRGALDLAGQDIIVSVAGGFRVTEPAADLTVMLAMASSLRNRALTDDWVAFGEVGLSSEFRPAPQAQRRVQEAARLGFSRCILPAANRERFDPPPGMRLVYVESVREAVQKALGDGASQAARESWQETAAAES